jgi:hypothetical protein
MAGGPPSGLVIAVEGDMSGNEVAEVAKQMMPADPDLAGAWRLIIDYCELERFDPPKIARLIDRLESEDSYIIDELVFEWREDKLYVDLLGDEYLCDGDELLSLLKKLRDAIGPAA